MKIANDDIIYIPFEAIISIKQIKPSLCTSLFPLGMFTRGQLINGQGVSFHTDLSYCLFSNASIENDDNKVDYIDDTNDELHLCNSPFFDKSSRIHDYSLNTNSSSLCCKCKPTLSVVFSPEVGPDSFLIGNDDVVVGVRERRRTGEAFRMYGGESKRRQNGALHYGMNGGESPVFIGI